MAIEKKLGAESEGKAASGSAGVASTEVFSEVSVKSLLIELVRWLGRELVSTGKNIRDPQRRAAMKCVDVLEDNYGRDMRAEQETHGMDPERTEIFFDAMKSERLIAFNGVLERCGGDVDAARKRVQLALQEQCRIYRLGTETEGQLKEIIDLQLECVVSELPDSHKHA